MKNINTKALCTIWLLQEIQYCLDRQFLANNQIKLKTHIRQLLKKIS